MSREQSNADEYRRIYELVQRQYDQACKDFKKACEEADRIIERRFGRLPKWTES